MKIEATYTSVGSLFEYRSIFFISKYQRAYAKNSESVESNHKNKFCQKLIIVSDLNLLNFST